MGIFKKFLGLDDENDDYAEDDFDTNEIEQEKKKIESERSKVFTEDKTFATTTEPKDKFKSGYTYGTRELNIVIKYPMSVEDCEEYIVNLRRKEPIIINLEKVESQISRRIVDYLNGAISALDGETKIVSNTIIIFAPKSVRISSPADGAEDPFLFMR